jgi:hypothetical protein
MSRHDEDHQSEGGIHIRDLSPGDVALFRNLADEAAEKAVEGFAVKMGLDPSQPLVSQRYFQVLRELTERSEDDGADRAFVRRWRPRIEGMPGKALVVIFGAAVLGAVNAFWTGFKAVVSATPLPHP